MGGISMDKLQFGNILNQFWKGEFEFILKSVSKIGGVYLVW